jgi:alkylated DNA nucleotide flippase Atl1
MTPFEEAVDAVLRPIPRGDVVTYGEVAEEAGFPGRARAVGHMLAASGGRYPWWRVVAANGRLVPGHEAEHARHLREEGVDAVDGRVRRMGSAGGRMGSAGGRSSTGGRPLNGGRP